MTTYSDRGSFMDEIASSPDVTMSQAIYTGCPTLFYM